MNPSPTENPCKNLPQQPPLPPADRARFVHGLLPESGLFDGLQWRISPQPFPLSSELVSQLTSLGGHLHAFNRAANQLYVRSHKGQAPSWVAEYLDRGKPPSLVEFARMNRFKNDLPRVIRPDILLTETGPIVSELDSVPGGIGLTGWLGRAYGSLGFAVLGGPCGMIRRFAAAVRAAAEKDNPAVAIIVSDESATYRPEMVWLAHGLREEEGLAAWCIEPRQIRFHEDGLALLTDDGEVRIDVVYRFFELFDLKNIPKAELVMYAARKGTVAVTPPFKPQLEEKMWMALFHHPALREYWKGELGAEADGVLRQVFPQTWILDNRPVPPHAAVAGFEFRGRPLQDWRDLFDASQRDRDWIIKISGFSERAWGSRGVVFGQDVPAEEWRRALEQALAEFPSHPHILQRFHRARQMPVEYYDFAASEVRTVGGRARLCPFYFVGDDGPQLGGVLATVCPADKKLLHGMPDAVMVPCVAT